MVSDTVEQLGGLHIAVNNAGINRSGPGEDTSEDDWNSTFAVNTTGVFLCCQVCRTHACDLARDGQSGMHLLQLLLLAESVAVVPVCITAARCRALQLSLSARG